MKGKFIDITGQVFGRLTAVDLSTQPNLRKGTWWNVQCECGNTKIVTSSNLRTGITRSCGCLAREAASIRRTIHGMFGTKIYASWASMIYRCNNPKAQAYHNYGGRGVTVCSRWLEFQNFYLDMGNSYWEGAEIDRTNNDGNYEPSNCGWVTTKANVRNKRNTWFVEYGGARRKLVELCEELGVSRRNVESRLYQGWSLEDSLAIPVRDGGRVTHVVGGRTMTVSQMAEAAGTSLTAMRSRLYRGATPTQALAFQSSTGGYQ